MKGKQFSGTVMVLMRTFLMGPFQRAKLKLGTVAYPVSGGTAGPDHGEAACVSRA